MISLHVCLLFGLSCLVPISCHWNASKIGRVACRIITIVLIFPFFKPSGLSSFGCVNTQRGLQFLDVVALPLPFSHPICFAHSKAVLAVPVMLTGVPSNLPSLLYTYFYRYIKYYFTFQLSCALVWVNIYQVSWSSSLFSSSWHPEEDFPLGSTTHLPVLLALAWPPWDVHCSLTSLTRSWSTKHKTNAETTTASTLLSCVEESCWNLVT